MRAATYQRFGGPEVLEITDTPMPKMQQDSVLVRVKAAALNPADLAIQAGGMKDAMDTLFPVIPGWDMAGVVEDVGAGVDEFQPGDSVIGYVRQPILGHGTLAEFVSTPVTTLIPKPAGVGWATAAALPLAGLTARQGLDALDLKSGQDLLVYGAGGAVGSIAAQLAVARGARVVGVASGRHHRFLTDHGVSPVERSSSVGEQVRRLAPDGVDAVFDAAGRGSLSSAAQLVRPGARVVTIADSSPAARTVFARLRLDHLTELAAAVSGGGLEIRIGRTYELDEARKAQQDVASGATLGKVVVVM